MLPPLFSAGAISLPKIIIASISHLLSLTKMSTILNNPADLRFFNKKPFRH